MNAKTIVGWILVTGLLGCIGAPPRWGMDSRLRAVDEDGRSVANARVSLFADESGTGLLRTASTDHDGVAKFVNTAPGRYVVEVAAPPHWNLAADEIHGRSVWLAAEPVTITVHELRMVGVRLPGGRLIGSSAGSWHDHDPAPAAMVRELPGWPPDALVLHGFRRASASRHAVAMDFTAEWFGYAPLVERQVWTVASKFAGPRVVDQAELVPMPWRELPVVLRDPDGTAMPAQTMHAVRRQCVLVRRDDDRFHRCYRLDPRHERQDRVAVPCGDYMLRLLQAGPWHEVPLTIGEDSVVIDGTLPLRLRLLRLRLYGAVGSDWSVRAEGKAHFDALWSPTANHVLELPLPVGESVLEFANHHEGTGYQRRTLPVVMRDEDVQEVVWNVR